MPRRQESKSIRRRSSNAEHTAIASSDIRRARPLVGMAEWFASQLSEWNRCVMRSGLCALVVLVAIPALANDKPDVRELDVKNVTFAAPGLDDSKTWLT